MRNILFTTTVSDMPDYFYISVRRRLFRYSLPTPPFGLMFLKINTGIDYLEYPDWDTFKASLKGLDVLGISFSMAEIPTVIKMVKIAREAGVKEIWGGNYGVLTQGIEKHFDRIFTGYAEEEVAEELGIKLDGVRHPPIITTFGMRNFPFKISHAFLFTNRGCRFKCVFCQTPVFTKGVDLLPLESVNEVLDIYRERKVKSVFIMDDNFFGNREYSEKVIDMLHEKGLNWGVCTRERNLKGRIAEFKEKGMFMCIIGVEAMRQENLDSINKGIQLDALHATIRELHEHHIYIHGTYMLGYEGDTIESTKADIKALAKLNLQSLQISIMTPLPETTLWGKLEKKYGISEKDLSKFDTYHLVWNHPNISKEEMDGLVKLAWKKCYPRRKNIQNLILLMRHGVFWRFIRR